MKAKSFVTVGLVVLLLSASAFAVGADDGARKLRFGVLFNNPTSDLSEGGQTTEADAAVGFFGAVEFPISERFGIEPAFGYAQHDVTTKESGFPEFGGETEWLALTVNGNFHLLGDSDFDLYVGPTLGYVFWGSIDLDEFPDDVSTDDELTYGLNVGFDYPFGDSSWGISAALRYLIVDVTPSDGSQGIGVDPLQLKIGVAYAF